MTTLSQLVDHITSATVVYRKGEVVKKQGNAITVDAFPERPDLTKTVDCGFVTVGFTEVAPTWGHEKFTNAVLHTCGTPQEWQSGPSYIHIGGWVGDQTLAFQLMALGELHGLWKVLTPAALRIPEDSDQYQTMIGGGFVMAVPSDDFTVLCMLAAKQEK